MKLTDQIYGHIEIKVKKVPKYASSLLNYIQQVGELHNFGMKMREVGKRAYI